MGRTIDTATLESASQHYAAAFLSPDRKQGDSFVSGPSFVMSEFYKFTFKDEFEQLLAGVREWMSARALKEFERLAGNTFKPRDEAVFHKLLLDKLAIDPDGGHVPGAIGTTKVHSNRLIGTHMIEVELPESVRLRKRFGYDKTRRATYFKEVPLYWPIYAGELEERLADSGVADALPPGTPSMPIGATNTRISNECAIGAADFVVDKLDEGTGAAVLQGRTGAQPTDPDTVVSGTNLFTIVCSDPAFGASSDAGPGGQATASGTPLEDTSADATGTLGYCRASATNDGATPLDDHIDGEAGVSGADFNFNTLSIVSGATVSLSSWTVTMPES